MFSNLVNMVKESPHCTCPRERDIDRITIHCYVGQVTAEQMAEYFATDAAKSSANYCVGVDCKIAGVVSENNRAWCSSSGDNDHRAINIEVACDTSAPYKVNDDVYLKLLDLVEDILARHNKTRLVWIPDKAQALTYKPASNEMVLTVHRWFAPKECPGEFLLNHIQEIARIVTRRIEKKKNDTPSDWAASAWSLCCSAGIFDGTDPRGPVTREMLAVVLTRGAEAVGMKNVRDWKYFISGKE